MVLYHSQFTSRSTGRNFDASFFRPLIKIITKEDQNSKDKPFKVSYDTAE